MRMRNLVLVCTLCFLSIPYVATGTETAGTKNVTPGLTADQIIAGNIKARGGLKRWRAVHAMSMSGKLDAGKVRPVDAEKAQLDNRMVRASARRAMLEKEKGIADAEKIIQLPFVMEMQRPRKVRLEITFQNQTAVQVFDGENGWKLRPFLGHNDAEPYTSDEMKLASQQQDLDGPLIDFAAKGTKVKLEGTELVDGSNTYKLQLTLKNGAVRYVWVDAKTFLEVKIDGSRRLDGKSHQVATYYRNYKPVDGLMIPFLLETRVEGIKDAERIIIERVALNPKLVASRFAKPQA